MRLLVAAVTVSGVALAAAPTAGADPQFVDHTEWAHWGDLSSLRVYPSALGRTEAGRPSTVAEADQAWAEVLALSPDADIPGMRAQFRCHWFLAELGHPGKTSWNLEPWRPAVSDEEMMATGCNPGGTEEPF